MKYRMLVFDLDGTLCGIGQKVPDEAVGLLRKLEDRGYEIAVCSGKTAFYLCGFLRQLGLKEPVIIGENGGIIQFGIDLPPAGYYRYPYSPTAGEHIRRFREQIDEKCGETVWYQPNEIGLTPFPKDRETFETIQKIIDDNKELCRELIIYRHADSFDFMPEGINKKNGLTYLSKLSGIPCERMISFGDGVNDIPMFECTKMSVKIGAELKYKTDREFSDITTALRWIDENSDDHL